MPLGEAASYRYFKIDEKHLKSTTQCIRDSQVLSGKESNAGDAGDMGSTLELQRSPGGGGNGNPLQYSSLDNLMDSGAWQAIFHGVTKESGMTVYTGTHSMHHRKAKGLE